VRFLCSDAFPGIGKKTAENVWKTLGEDCLTLIQEHPEKLMEVKGLNPDKRRIIQEGIVSFSGFSQSYMQLTEWGLSQRQIVMLQETYSDPVKVIEADPFRPMYEIKGFGYKSALKLADAVRMEPEDFRRRDARLFDAAGMLSMRTGFTYVTMAQLYDVCPMEPALFEDSLDRLEASSCLQREDDRIYPFDLLEEEEDIARDLAMHDFEVDKVDPELIEEKINVAEFALNITYDDRQKEALRTFFDKSLFILNGGPGTGKTTTVKGILQMAKSIYPDAKIQLCAPTGRAAKRLAQLSDNDARTIHSLLKWNIQDNTFQKNEEDPLDCDFLIADEFSMVDTHLFASLLKALPEHCRILLIGDEDQLESVGPGKVFADIIASHQIPVVHLQRIFRQAHGSGIVALAQEIREKTPFSYEDGVTFTESGPLQTLPAILSALDAFPEPESVQILAPMYKGPAGIDAINEALQEKFNPASKYKPQIKTANAVYRLNDKVMLLKNMPEEDIYNGDIGTIVEIEPKSQSITVDFGHTESTFTKDIPLSLTHAWCVSVHKAQGSEYDDVFVIAQSQNPGMLEKRLIYTAVSRAKKHLHIFGSQSLFETKARESLRRIRQTTLKKRIIQAYESEKPLF
jgi:exodeoxyribonuclease V alpha subunit